MDPMYNIELAKTQLERAVDSFNKQKMNTKALDMIETAEYDVVNIEAPRSWRIVKRQNTEGSEGVLGFEEEMFDIHGILCGYDLPPIQTRDIFYLKKKAKFIRQAIQITGFNTPIFHKTVSKIDEILELMKNSIAPHTITEWHPATYEGEHALDVSARYFTPRRNVPHERGQSFGIGVDPNGILADIRGQELIHGNENKVEYLQEIRNENDELIRKEIEPALFNIGDIVRATVAFVLFPTRNGNASMTVQLRALTQIESFKSKTNEIRVMPSTIHRTNTIKRKSILNEEKEAREGLERMKIDDDANRDKRFKS